MSALLDETPLTCLTTVDPDAQRAYRKLLNASHNFMEQKRTGRKIDETKIKFK